MTSVRERLHALHPLHTLRKNRLFRAVTRTVDPIVRSRSPLLARPIYLRLFANASLIADPMGQESTIRELFGAILESLPRPAGAFWDVGANVGLFTWQCATLRPDIDVLAFEPDTKNLQCLQKTHASWPGSRVTIKPCAVAERAGRAQFFVDDVSGATGTIETGGGVFNTVQYGSTPPVVDVETVTLDGMVAGGAPLPAVIKIDVEQAELRVLQGGVKLLRENRPLILVEAFGDRPATFGFLRECGYELFDSERKQPAGADSVNLLAVPADFSTALRERLVALGYPLSPK